ncbi:MAG TPA: 1-deoxy-D-xylulose-5-phosphate synthase [Abditibacteriaceae bacterium]|jgi:1-deoxy-D-xylulose-5-phosphate synthase
MALIEHINGPADLKRLNPSQLPEVAAEVRRVIIDTIAEVGGHFGGPLGAVELCVALHYVLDSPKDKIVWDVGYQAYAHKILTGRRDTFHTLRQWGGVAPFPRCEESPHDTTNPGHGSTSISAALGYALARDLKKTDETVVAVIGDGSLVGGLALEGLHQAGHMGSNLIVLLNDNEMGISHNYSSLARYLRRVRTDPVYRHSRQRLEEVFKKLPGGELVIEAGGKMRAGVKSMVVPGMWFEELGYHYLGPINGHSIPEVAQALKTARSMGGPVLIHAVTTKGKGFEKAEAKDGQIKWHAASPADFPSDLQLLKKDEPQEDRAGLAKPKAPKTYTEVFSETLCELAAKDERICAITAAMPGGTGIDKFIEKFPKRGFDVGMVEEHAVTFASGLALGGLKPVVAIYSTFMQRAYDQIMHDVCQVRDGLPVVFALDRGGLVGEDGATHQGVFDFCYGRNIPHLHILAPSDENELRHALVTALALDKPAMVRYPRGTGLGLEAATPEILPTGKGRIVRDVEGEIELSVLCAGHILQPALQAADILRAEGRKVAVFDARWVKPLDETGISVLVRRSKAVITAEENAVQGGFGSAILELLAREGILVPTQLVGVPDEFVHHGHPKIQRRELGLDADGLLYTMRRTLADATPKKKSLGVQN